MSNNLMKWTPQEDQMLKEGYLKFGKDWNSIKTHMNHLRSITSIIKRWHVRIKEHVPSPQILFQKKQNSNSDNQSQESQEQKSKIMKENQDNPRFEKWTANEDQKLKSLITNCGILDWEKLAKSLGRQKQDVKQRWINKVCPNKVQQTGKIGGLLKWSHLQDQILAFAQKQRLDWQGEGGEFLPHRSLGSIDTRWRRISKQYQSFTQVQNKAKSLRQFMRKMGQKKQQNLIINQPAQ